MAQEQVQALLNLIDESVNDFIKDLPDVQRQNYARLINLTRELELDSLGGIKNNVSNLRLLGKIRSEVDSLMKSDFYVNKVHSLVSVYDKLQALNNIYFESVTEKFTPKKVFDQVKKLNVDTTIESLTEAGIGTAYTDTIKQILKANITSGASYADMTEALRNTILGDKNNDGALVRYARQIVVDSVNQFNANYNKAVSDDLGLEWYQYVGSIIKTSRPFCKALTQKRYFHISEVAGFLSGQVGFRKTPVSDRTGLPVGFIEDTNEQTFFVNRGGYQCQHQIYPVPAKLVPEEIRNSVLA